MPVSFYEVSWIFVIFAFLGWCTEVAYATLKTRKFVNRGFLNGPVCPIYGFGVLVVILVLTPLKHRILILLAGS
ncbi:MAG: putative ABC transporter permease, partial [Clostridiales bacterium]|nr:putative ABC transporter permease [Clostridiales bacterium]